MEDGKPSGGEEHQSSASDSLSSLVNLKQEDSVDRSNMIPSGDENLGQVHVENAALKPTSNGHQHKENTLSSHSPLDVSESGSSENPRIIIDDVIPIGAVPLSHVKTKLKQDDVASARGSSPARSTGSPSSIGSPRSAKQFDPSRRVIDTTAPFESVKEAVSKFGGIVDWKAHRVQTYERQKLIELELEKVHAEMPEFKKQSDKAEEEKLRVLQELDNTKRLIEELKLNLERVQTEEQQATQDSELAKLRVEEMEHGIADEASVAAKAQLEVAKARQSAAVSELKSVKEEMGSLQKEYSLLMAEKEEAVRQAEKAVSASKEVEKSVQELTIELIAAKESLESAQAAHLEAEEHRIGALMAREQDSLLWEKELKRAEDELQKLNQKVMYTKDLKLKYEIASSLLRDLKAELAAYMDPKPCEEENQDKKSHVEIQSAVESAKKELAEVKTKIEKATAEVNILKDTVKTLETELGDERASLAAIRQREGMALVAISSLEGDLGKTLSEIDEIQKREKEMKEKLVEIPKELQAAAQAADDAKVQEQLASEELRKAKEELEQVKARAGTTQSRLLAAQKEIEAAKASEKLALAAIKALQESDSSLGDDDVDSPCGITLTLEEYYELSKRAHDAEEEANGRVAAALAQIKTAHEAEKETMLKLELVTQEMASRKEVLKQAMDKAEKAKEGKLGVEQELRKWRAEHEQRRKAAETNQVMNPSKPPLPISEGIKETMEITTPNAPQSSRLQNGYISSETKPVKKKKSIFPRFFMFLGRKKAGASKAV